VSRNPLLYSEQSEAEDTNTIEPIEVKRSFIFYFIVLANSLLVVVVLLIIWSLFSKTPNTSFDQQVKAWSQQLFDTSESNQVQTVIAPSAPVVKVDTQEEQAAIQKKELEQLKLEKERIEKELALKAEQRKLELQALKLKEEKEKAAAILESPNKTNTVENNTTEEAAIIPNAAKSIAETPSDTAKTQLEQILETMQNQN
jgi:hypothetical protein